MRVVLCSELILDQSWEISRVQNVRERLLTSSSRPPSSHPFGRQPLQSRLWLDQSGLIAPSAERAGAGHFPSHFTLTPPSPPLPFGYAQTRYPAAPLGSPVAFEELEGGEPAALQKWRILVPFL